HAERMELDIDQVPMSQLPILARVSQDAPFRALAGLIGSRRVPRAEVANLVKAIEGAPSEAAAVELVHDASRDLTPTGPSGDKIAVNTKAKRMRMGQPQVVNLAPPM